MPPGVGTADPAGKATKQETNAKTLTVVMGDSLPSDAVVHTIKALILRASGHITFQLLRPADFPTMCGFEVLAEWESPELTAVGWQTVRDCYLAFFPGSGRIFFIQVCLPIYLPLQQIPSFFPSFLMLYFSLHTPFSSMYVCMASVPLSCPIFRCPITSIFLSNYYLICSSIL